MSSNRSYTDETFDHVIFACHGDQILPILSGRSESRNPIANGNLRSPDSANGSISRLKEPEKHALSRDELEVFNTFKTTENVCYLHSDLSLMPIRRQTWSSWNYMIESHLKHSAGVSLTYNMNILQHVSEQTYGSVLVTMNPGHEPKPELTQGKYIYRHPLYTVEAVRAQERLESIQNQRGVSYCGAWTKYGFHEDGFSSGLKAAMDHLGAKLPFEFQDSTYSRGHRPELNTMDHILRAVLWITLIQIRILELTFRLPVVSYLVRVIERVGVWILDMLEKFAILD